MRDGNGIKTDAKTCVTFRLRPHGKRECYILFLALALSKAPRLERCACWNKNVNSFYTNYLLGQVGMHIVSAR